MKKVFKNAKFFILAILVVSVLTACGEHVHTWIDATCTSPQICSECGEETGEPIEHSISEWTTTKEATCSEVGISSGICSSCNETIEKEIVTIAHTPGEWEVTTAATPTSNGVRSLPCSICGETMETESFSLSPEEFKAMCKTYSYTEIARNPQTYRGTYAKYTGEVVQVMEEGNLCNLRVNITRKGSSYTYYTDTIFVVYTRPEGSSRILENDIITIYGINEGMYSYETVLGSEMTIPRVDAYYIDQPDSKKKRSSIELLFFRLYTDE